jgi:hypothetical protein
MSKEKQQENDNDKIDGRCPFPFAQLPNHIAQNPNISDRALAVISYLISHGTKWQARVSDIKKRFKYGDKAWWKISKELRELGVLSDKPTKEGRILEFHPYKGMFADVPPKATLPKRLGSQKGRIYKERENIKKDIYKDHDPVDNLPPVDKIKKEEKTDHDYYKKIKLTNEQKSVRDELIKYGWDERQATLTVINRKLQLMDFYTIFDEIRKNKKTIINKGAYIRKSINNLLKQRK